MRAGARRSQDLHPASHPTRTEAAQRLAHRGHQQEEPDTVGQEARGDEQRACDEDHRSVRQLVARKATAGERRLHPAKLAASLARHERRSDEGCEQHEHHGRPEAEPVTDDDEQGDLDERDDREQHEERGHGAHQEQDTGTGRLSNVNHRRLPSVDVLARALAARSPGSLLPRPLVVEAARTAISEARSAGNDADPDLIARNLVAALAARRPHRIVNATGVLLHTNLGRAPLHPEAAAAATAIATGYGNVEFDVTTGTRGGRHAYLDELLRALTGAEAGLAVNNNAGALLLSLAALAAPGDAVVSRGELIEIGGSFRLPELMNASGARLVEVGTTNRTRPSDYRGHLAAADVVLKVHPSNYRVEGFAEEVGYRELAALAGEAGIPFIADVGSGLLDARTPWMDGPPPTWLATEPGVRQTLDAGADLVLFSGDKLLGGPQAGLVVGRRDLVGQMSRHPMMRALRLDGPTLAALTVTLELYGAGRAAEIPFWEMAAMDASEITRRVDRLHAAVERGEIVEGTSLPGAGSVPGEVIPTPVLAVAEEPEATWRRLLDGDPPVLARRNEGRLMVDLRSVHPADDDHVARLLRGP